MYFLSGVQQNDTGRVISPIEKSLQQAEPFNSHHKTKKLRLDESLSGGLVILLQDRFIPSISYLFIQGGSPKHVCLILPLSSLFLSLSFPTWHSLISCPLSGLSLRDVERGSVSLQPEESCSEESPWYWWAEGFRCCLLACLTTEPCPYMHFIFLLPKSVQEPYIVLDLFHLYHSSV